MKDIVIIIGAVLLRILLVAPFMLLFWWLRRRARKSHPRQTGTSLEFSIAPGMLILIRIVSVALVAFTALVAMVAIRGDGSLYALLIPLSVLGAILLATPKRILIDHKGIHQQRLLGPDRVIGWTEVAWMRRGKNTGATYVKSRNGGHPISFSPLLVGQSRFEREVKSYAGDFKSDE